jgi:hypothetical protein
LPNSTCHETQSVPVRGLKKKAGSLTIGQVSNQGNRKPAPLSEESSMDPLFAFLEGMFKPSHLIVVMIVGVLLFGKRLP